MRVETTLENELGGLIAAAGMRGRRAEAVARRLGLDGNGQTTLQSAADRCGYSRERVRQLEAILRRHVARTQPGLPAVRAAVAMLESAAPDDRAFLGGLLVKNGVAERPFDPTGVVAAAELARIATPLAADGRFVTVGARPGEMLTRAARLLAADRAEVEVSLLGGLYGFDDQRVRRLLADRQDVRWTSDERSAFCLATPALERRVAGVLRKLLAIVPRLPLAELDDALRTAASPVALPPRVLGGICSSFAWAEVDDERAGVRVVVPLDRRRVLSRIELALARIFLEFGPVLPFRDVVRRGREAGLNPSSIGVYLTRTPILSRLERGRYALRGVAA